MTTWYILVRALAILASCEVVTLVAAYEAGTSWTIASARLDPAVVREAERFLPAATLMARAHNLELRVLPPVAESPPGPSGARIHEARNSHQLGQSRDPGSDSGG